MIEKILNKECVIIPALFFMGWLAVVVDMVL